MKINKFNLELCTNQLLISRAKNKAFKKLSRNIFLFGENDSRSILSKFKYLKWFQIEMNIRNELNIYGCISY